MAALLHRTPATTGHPVTAKGLQEHDKKRMYVRIFTAPKSKGSYQCVRRHCSHNT